jgi:uncharacterized membrane protein YozB (DUF420 family)
MSRTPATAFPAFWSGDKLHLAFAPSRTTAGVSVLTGPNVILALKLAVGAVTVLLVVSLTAVVRGNYRLHGRINLVFFTLTLAALLGLEVLIRFVNPDVFQYIRNNEALYRALTIHLCFSVPSAIFMPAMLYTGLRHHRAVHLTMASIFGILWTGTFVTGIFFLPHAP